MKRLGIAVAITFLTTLGASAQDQNHPNLERGVHPEKLYNFSEIDAINPFNGNLTLRLPIGPLLSVNGALPYQLTLSYNSHQWDFTPTPPVEPDHDTGTLEPTPTVGMNAGLGWMLMLSGSLSTKGSDGGGLGATYKSADGASHRLTGWVPTAPANTAFGFTNDSSHIRAHQIDDRTVEIELPSGVRHTFKNFSTGQVGTWLPVAVGTTNSEWRLSSITDRFSNGLTISYSSDSTYSEIWKFNADYTPTTTVYFKREVDLTGSTWSNALVDHITTPTVGGGASTYTFHYTLGDHLALPLGSLPPGGGSAPTSVNVALLTSIDLPEGQKYSSLTYDTRNPTETSGVLTALTLPTGGTIQWTYGAESDFDDFSWPVKAAPHAVPSVVTSRSFGGGTWTYARNMARVSCVYPCLGSPSSKSYGGSRQLTTWVTAPDGATTVSYFSTFIKGELSAPRSDFCMFPAGEAWLSNEYGLPLTRSTGVMIANATQFDPTAVCPGTPPDAALNGGSAALTGMADSVPRFLSTETRTGFVIPSPSAWNGFGRVPSTAGTALRSSWLRYDLDSSGNGLVSHETNARVAASLTFFEDDPTGCKPLDTTTPCRYSGANSYGYDGYGHYRQSSSLGTFGGSADYRTIFTNYSTALPGGNNWILGTFTEQCTVDETSQRTTAVTACSDLPSAKRITNQVQFDAATGAITARRVKDTTLSNGAAHDTHDLLSLFTYDHGLVSSEKYYGGDNTPLSSTTGFATSTAADYEVDHLYTFSNGALTKVQSTYAGGNFNTEDVDLDPSTGVVIASRDTAQSTTSYDYSDPANPQHAPDGLNRLRVIRPPSDAVTEYIYTNANGTTPAGLSVRRYSADTDLTSAGAQALTDNEYYFDAWGRLLETKVKMPDAWSSVVRSFDAMGRLSSTGMPERRTAGTYESFTPVHQTSFTYDPFGRQRSIRQADNSLTTLDYTGTRQTVRTNSDLALPSGSSTTSATATQTYDRLGRLVSVTEQSGPTSSSSGIGSNVTTAYAYDVADHLISVQSGPQLRTFEYDGRGFLLTETHPEKGISGNGTTLYQVTDAAGNIDGYDAKGHSHRRVDGAVGGSFDLALTYDSAERLTKLKDVDPASTSNPKARRPLKDFTFAPENGASNYKKGRLETAVRHNYPSGLTGDIVVTDTYKYVSRSGRPSARDTLVENVNGPTRTTLQSLTQNFTYDQLGATSQIDYPICTATVPCGGLALTGPLFTRTNGFLTAVATYAPSITYNADGSLFEVTHNSGSIKDTYSPDNSGMTRPGMISFAGVSSCNASATVSGDQTIAAGQTAVIVVAFTGSAPWSITWSDGISLSGITQNPLTRNVSPAVSTTYTVTNITDGTSCAGSSTGSARVTVQACNASATVSGGGSITIGQSTQIQVSLAGTAPWSITWSDGIQETGINTNTWQRTVTPTANTTYSITTVADGTGCAGSRSGSASVTVAGLPAPAGLQATTAGNTLVVNLSWTFVQGAAWYQVERATRLTLNDWQAVGPHVTSGASTDSFGATPNPVTYLYRVRRGITIGSTDYVSDPSQLDYATVATTLFTDEPLNNGVTKTTIRGIHIGELRQAIDAVRYAAGTAYPPAWASYAAATGWVLASDNTTARQKLDEAVIALVHHGVPYSGEVPTGNSRIWAYQVQQIRDGVR